MQENLELLKTHEEEAVNAEIIVIAPKGLGFGEGKISTAAQLESGELTEKGLAIAHEIITTRADSVFVTISSEIADDGCGDGRPAVDTWVVDDEGNEIHYNKSYPRAKVFGGGLVVASSMWRAVSGAPHDGNTLLGDREFIAGQLSARGLDYGGHCDEHAEGTACGCGAIDKYPDISNNIVRYRSQISTTLQALYGASYEAALPAVSRAFAVYEDLADDGVYFSNAAGKDTMDLMTKDGAVIKKLAGGHQEDVIVLNDIEGDTFDQVAFDELIRDGGVQETVQAFVVDVWRGRMYAEAIANIAQSNGVEGDRTELAQTAYADFLIRTLAVAATLTNGDLPVYARRRVGQQDFALAT